ncbi:putative bifunctional diguanylate cyclase/phosphodiesterase [Novosphingobium colocasiae]|uniref:putative bifunctional diguanylate cyclase/phosphodiesterase n=1 Tax=Novosphingobium colocasiae TaxID=1256513 RepID=UPI0035B23171
MEFLHNPPTDIHALIVDDDDVDRERLTRMLHHGPRRISVVEATSRAEALQLIRRPATHFDIVFLDFGLTDGDGRDLVPAIHQELDPDCPIVAVTGNGDEQIAAAAIKSGMTEFLTKKALSAEKVAASVEECMAWRKYRQDLRRAEAELTHRSMHDPLTDLPNRSLFFDRLEQHCARARRSGDPVAVVMIDLDRFKEVNDSLGHAAGDMVLGMVARRLRANLREVDTIARLGGDEFALILQNIATHEAALQIVGKLIKLVEQPILHDQRVLYVGASAGVALCPQLGYAPTALLSAADATMYDAKRGIDKVVVATDTLALGLTAIDRPVLLDEFEAAMAANEVDWHWQPKIDMRDGRITGFETLVRWNRAKGEPISPEHLVRTVEQSPLLETFTYHCLDRVLAEFAPIRSAVGDVTLAVNISPRVLERPGFVERVAEKVRLNGIDPRSVTLELTETALINNPAQTRRVIESLLAHHIQLSIDDFGAGFTSFGYLREFPVGEIKIDRSFIARFSESRFDQSLVSSLVVLCESLGIPLVAEGVETLETRQRLVALGCHYGQGYGICPPIPYAQVMPWIAKWYVSLPGKTLSA